MIDRMTIETAARELGAAAFGIGDLSLFDGEDPRRDPKMVCPQAKCLIGFGIPVPKGLYKTMKEGSQFYTYTTVGVKAIDEEYFEIFLFKMASLLEDAGYDACLQRTTPNLKVKGDKTCNPETIGIYELTYQANKLASTNFRYLETLMISALVYFVLTFTTSRLLGLLERRMRRGDR